MRQMKLWQLQIDINDVFVKSYILVNELSAFSQSGRITTWHMPRTTWSTVCSAGDTTVLTCIKRKSM
jgi:hypothetical protein